MVDFYNSSFQVLFSFGYNYPQQIVAKAAEKVKVFHGKTEEIEENEKRVRDTSLWKFTCTDDRKVWEISPVS